MGIKDWLKKREKVKRLDSVTRLVLSYLSRAGENKDEKVQKCIISEGIEKVTKEIDRQPDQALLYYLRAELFNFIKEYAKSKEDFEKIPLDDKEVLKTAKKQGVDLIELVPMKLAFLEYNLGNYDKAAENFLKTKMRNIPREFLQNPELLHFAKGCLFDMDAKACLIDKDERAALASYEHARREYEKVLELSPDLNSKFLKEFPWFPKKDKFYLNLAMDEYHVGNVDDAKKYCERALEINRFNKDAKKFLKYLEKERESEPEKREKLSKAAKVLREVSPVIEIEQKGGEYKIGEVSGKSGNEALSNYFMKLTGGKKHITPIPGRESLVMHDLLQGYLSKWENYLLKNPEIRNEPSEVQTAFFEKEILGKKVNIEKIRKRATNQSEEDKKGTKKVKGKPDYIY